MKVLGVGLNKTGTKTLGNYLKLLGLKHHTYSLDMFKAYQAGDWDTLWATIDEYDSFEDWPWPLMYQEFDKRYPDAKFILTTRKTPETWYRSLCKMAVRMGPLKDFEQHIYGYAMPHGHQKEHINIYNKHNKQVEAYFADQPDKLLKVCWGTGSSISDLAEFLALPIQEMPKKTHANQSDKVYSGDTLWKAHLHRIRYQSKWYARQYLKAMKKSVKRQLGRQ